jgi:hypothetical protein
VKSSDVFRRIQTLKQDARARRLVQQSPEAAAGAIEEARHRSDDNKVRRRPSRSLKAASGQPELWEITTPDLITDEPTPGNSESRNHTKQK